MDIVCSIVKQFIENLLLFIPRVYNERFSILSTYLLLMHHSC